MRTAIHLLLCFAYFFGAVYMLKQFVGIVACK